MAGQTHDPGAVRLTAVGRSVRGTVVGLDGKPVAGVTVFRRGDGQHPSAVASGADGSFTLRGLFEAPALVLTKKTGYRPPYLHVRPGGELVRLILRKTSESPAPPPDPVGHEAALQRLTRSMLEMLWADREHLGEYERSVLRDMARFDPATARKWRDEEKTRSGGKNDLTRFLDEVERERPLLDTARTDIDEALARIPANDGQEREILSLGEQLLAVDRAKALRAAEEVAVRARGLNRYPVRGRWRGRATSPSRPATWRAERSSWPRPPNWRPSSQPASGTPITGGARPRASPRTTGRWPAG